MTSWTDIKTLGSLVATTYYPGGLAVPTYRYEGSELTVWCHECEWQGKTDISVDYSPKSVLTEETYLLSFICPQCAYEYKAEPRYYY